MTRQALYEHLAYCIVEVDLITWEDPEYVRGYRQALIDLAKQLFPKHKELWESANDSEVSIHDASGT